MNVVIGKVIENGRDKAYAILFIEEQKKRLLTRDAVKNLLLQGEKIVGFDLNCNRYGRYNLHKIKPYMWKNMPEINGKGQAESEADKAVELFIGTNGFKEVKVYVTVNSNGDIRLYNKDSFIKRIEQDDNTIIGAGLQNKEDEKELKLYIRNMLTDDWMEQLGYKRDENFNWTK